MSEILELYNQVELSKKNINATLISKIIEDNISDL